MTFATIGNRHTAQRIIEAERSFLQTLATMGDISLQRARTVMDAYRKAKVIKLDAVMGKYSVKHGALLDRDVIRRAASI